MLGWALAGWKEEIAVEVEVKSMRSLAFEIVEVVTAAAEVSSEGQYEAVYCKNPSVHATGWWDLTRHMAVASSLPAPAIQASEADSSEEAPAVEKHAQMTVWAYNLRVQG